MAVKILIRAFFVAMVVGPVLTLINQWEGIVANQPFSVSAMLLTTLVPFIVSCFSSLITIRSMTKNASSSQAERINLEENQEKFLTCQVSLQKSVDIIKTVLGNATNVNKNASAKIDAIKILVNKANNAFERFSELNEISKKGSEDTAIMLERTAELTDSIHLLTHELTHSSQKVQFISDHSSSLSTIVNEVTASCNEIQSIARGVKLISLNASIEAARAGDHGRGFAVVAEKVRDLSEQTDEKLVSINGSLNKLVEATQVMQSLCHEFLAVSDACNTKGSLARSETEVMQESIRLLSQDVVYTAHSLDDNLPTLAELVDALKMIDQNNAAAVNGSANNMKLCSEVIQLLDTQLQ